VAVVAVGHLSFFFPATLSFILASLRRRHAALST
jgi:hypothetical protein